MIIHHYLEVSWNGGYPQITYFRLGFSTMNHPFWGTPIYGNTHHLIKIILMAINGVEPPWFWETNIKRWNKLSCAGVVEILFEELLPLAPWKINLDKLWVWNVPQLDFSRNMLRFEPSWMDHFAFFWVVEPFWGLRIWLGFSVVNVAVCGFHFINMWLLCVCVPKHVHLVISNLLFVKYRAGLSCQMVKWYLSHTRTQSKDREIIYVTHNNTI